MGVALRSEKRLHVLIAEQHVGELSQHVTGRLSFIYDDAWRDGPIQIPLSLSMPLAAKEHPDAKISAFIWGLLPDNEVILSRWAQQFGVSARNAFALISAVGEDCAGAVQFLTPEKLNNPAKDDVVWLAEENIGRRLAELRADSAATRRRTDKGQFSLAGAQAKTAFYYEAATDRWGVPQGRVPTTHIFKPPMPHLNGQTENEHFCLCLANMAGLKAAKSIVRCFDGEKVIVVERYDRLLTPNGIIRIHQEDMCQALGVPPSRKYESDGGPGIAKIITEVLPACDDIEADCTRFMEANIFNFLIAGSDAHAKNYSILLGPQTSARLAPLYDISSILPHLGEGEVQAEMRDIRMVMNIGGHYEMEAIMPRHWERLAKSARFSPNKTIALMRRHIARLPDLAASCAAHCQAEGVTHPIIPKLADLIALRVAKLALIYGSEL